MTLSREEASSGSEGGFGEDVAVDAPGATPRTATMFACVTTLSNTLLGVSVVGVAGGFARAGCLIGTFYLLLFASLAGSGLHLLARSSMTVSKAARRKADAEEAEWAAEGAGGTERVVLPPSSFRAVALVGAPRWAFLIDLAVALKCFGVATSYLVVIGDLMPVVMSDIIGDSHPDSFLLDRHVWVTVGFFLAAPLAFSRTLGALKYTATLAIGLVIFLSGMVMSFWLLPGLDACPVDETVVYLDEKPATAAGFSGNENSLDSFPSPLMTDAALGDGVDLDGGICFEGSNAVGTVRSILQTLPIFVFCFTCHQNIFTICNELVRPTPARVDAVIVSAMLVATATYLSLSWGAYATFGVGVDGDLLETYPRTGLLTVARICVSILVTSCYPLQAHPSRLCILSSWKAFSGDMEKAYAGLESSGGQASSATVSPSPPNGAGRYTAVSADADDVQRNAASPHTSRAGGTVEEVRIGGGGGGEEEELGNHTRRSRTTSRDGSSSPEHVLEERGRRGVVGGGTATRDGWSAVAGEPDGEARDGGVKSPERTGLLSDSPRGLLSDDVPVDAGANEAQGDQDGGNRGSHPCGEVTVDVDSAERSFPGTRVHPSVVGERSSATSFWTSHEGFRHIVVTAAFLGLSYGIAMTVSDLGILLEVVGATGSTTIAFILPGLLYLKVHPEPHPKRSLAALQLVAGLVIIPVALTFIALGDSREGRR